MGSERRGRSRGKPTRSTVTLGRPEMGSMLLYINVRVLFCLNFYKETCCFLKCNYKSVSEADDERIMTPIIQVCGKKEKEQQ